MLQHLNQGSQHERMKQMKIKGSRNENMKAEIMRDYMDEGKGSKFKNLDLKKVEKETEIDLKKGVPMSAERRMYECMREIRQCKNFYELKSKLDLETKGALTKKIGDIKSQQLQTKRYTDSVSLRRRLK